MTLYICANAIVCSSFDIVFVGVLDVLRLVDLSSIIVYDCMGVLDCCIHCKSSVS